jgi:hypothetical protein
LLAASSTLIEAGAMRFALKEGRLIYDTAMRARTAMRPYTAFQPFAGFVVIGEDWILKDGG